MLTLRTIESAADFPRIRDLWNRVYSEGETPSRRHRYTMFQSYAWNEIAARVFADRERPYVVVVESDSGAAIIPACVRDDGVSLLGEELFDYRDVLSTDGDSLDVAWREVERLGLPLRVKATRGERPFGEAKFFAGAPWLPASHHLRRNKKLERNLRLLRARGCTLSCNRAIGSSRGRVAALARRMYELKARSEKGSLFADLLRVEAVVEMAMNARSELVTIEKDSELVGAILTFVDGNVCRFYGTYYDERWAVYSPGVSLLYIVIRQAQAHGLDFDFMTGEQPYKMRFATEVMPLYIVERVAAASLAA